MYETVLSRRLGCVCFWGVFVFHYVKSPGSEKAIGFGLPEVKPIAPKGFYAQYLKRFLDVCFILLAAPVVLPIVGLFALLTKRDGGPAFYAQKRIGRDGRTFNCWKIRSMVVDADQVLEQYLADNPEANAEWLVSQKLRNDPRITKLGKFIRKSSIDELPQLWCVFKGEMSLVGPRPFLPEQKPLYKGNAYYILRPGLTGFWQVSDRNESSFASRAVYDNRYAAEFGMMTDLKILFRTIGVVVRATGM